MLNAAEFALKHGSPAIYRFNGKCYDTGTDGKQFDDVCGRRIRAVFTIVQEHNEREKLHIGTCCFRHFQQENPKLFQALLYAKGYLRSIRHSQESAIKRHGQYADVRTRLVEWRRIKRQAASRIRKYREESGKQWLPEMLFELEQIALQPPPQFKRTGMKVNWLDRQIRKMTEGIAKLSV